jgi:hypothetical protein
MATATPSYFQSALFIVESASTFYILYFEMDDKRDGDRHVRLDPRCNGTYFCELCKCSVPTAKNIPEHVNGNMHRKLERAEMDSAALLLLRRRDALAERVGRRDDDDRRYNDDRRNECRRRDDIDRRHGDRRGCRREQRDVRMCDEFGRLRLDDAKVLGAKELANAKRHQHQRAAPKGVTTEAQVPTETNSNVRSKVEAESTRWQKENINDIKSNFVDPFASFNPQPGGGGTKLAKNASSPLRVVHAVDLVIGLESAERAMALRDACSAECSMLKEVLVKIGFVGSLVDENSNIKGVRSYKVEVKKSHDDKYSVIFEYSTRENIPMHRMSKLLEVFARHESAGFLEWLGGAKGWRFDCPVTEGASWKKCAVIQLNTLQGVFKLFAKDTQKYFFENSQRMAWRKQDELTDVVNDVRVWIETITPRSELTRQMLRNSSMGPDSLVHWAHHHPVRSCACASTSFLRSHLNTSPNIICFGISNSANVPPPDCCIGINHVGTCGGV